VKTLIEEFQFIINVLSFHTSPCGFLAPIPRPAPPRPALSQDAEVPRCVLDEEKEWAKTRSSRGRKARTTGDLIRPTSSPSGYVVVCQLPISLWASRIVHHRNVGTISQLSQPAVSLPLRVSHHTPFLPKRQPIQVPTQDNESVSSVSQVELLLLFSFAALIAHGISLPFFSCGQKLPTCRGLLLIRK